MPIFIWEIWIPLLKLVHSCDRELFNEVTVHCYTFVSNILGINRYVDWFFAD